MYFSVFCADCQRGVTKEQQFVFRGSHPILDPEIWLFCTFRTQQMHLEYYLTILLCSIIIER